jgi:hypothetical protein
MVSAMTTAVKNAKKLNMPNGILITTTKGRLDQESGVFTERLLSKGYQFHESLYDLNDREVLSQVINSNSTNQLIVCEFSYRQLGETDEWLRSLISKLNITDFDIVKRDYLNIPTMGSASNPIPGKLIEKAKSAVMEPIYVEHINFMEIRWYLNKDLVKGPEFKNIPIILGMDSSENIGNDYTALVFLDARNGVVIGTMRVNESNINKFGKFVANLLVINPNILFVPERKSTGSTIIDIILTEFEIRNINPLRRIYNTFFQDTTDDNKLIEYKNLRSIHGPDRKRLGFSTNKSRRNLLYKTVLIDSLTRYGDKIYDNTLVNEIAGLIIRDGRVDHKNKKHDDVCFAWLLCHHVLSHGKNLDCYDFLITTRATILKDVKLEKSNSNDVLYSEMKLKLEELKATRDKAKSLLLKRYIDLEIRAIKRLLPEDFELMVTDAESLRSNKVKRQPTIIERDYREYFVE